VHNQDVPFAGLPPRERILVTAHDLFYRDGIRATGIDRVIAQAKVTKVTFYRHYPSKHALIREYLAYRHERWMHWLRSTLERHTASGRPPMQALLETFEEWWSSPDYRGCAFINSAAELGTADPDLLDIVRQHKAEMTAVFEGLLVPGPMRRANAKALALAIDGAIVHAQMGLPIATLLDTLKLLIEPVLAKKRPMPAG
jgi:AcrR family transcriptional regulator